MGCDKEGQALPLHNLFERPIPLRSRPRLHVRPWWALAESNDVAHHSKLFAHLSYKRGVFAALFPKTMIDMARFDLNIEKAPDLEKTMQKN
jgi:hypothetical protein